MSNSVAKMLVSVVDQVVCIKIIGRANFTASVDFKKLVYELHRRGRRHFIIDLAECMLMDSTFLGVLAGIGVKFGSSAASADSGTLELLNPTQRVSDLLDNLGVMEMFRVVKGADAQHLHFETVELTPCSKLESSRNCLEAHRTLMEVNPQNVAKFKDVAQFLEMDLKNLEAEAEPVK